MTAALKYLMYICSGGRFCFCVEGALAHIKGRLSRQALALPHVGMCGGVVEALGGAALRNRVYIRYFGSPRGSAEHSRPSSQ